MRYAVLQKTLETPELDKLVRAFKTVPSLTAADAATAVHDAYGVLIKQLAEDDACFLQQALQAEGIDTVVVAQRDLPDMPPFKVVRRLGLNAENLEVFDPLGRSFQVPAEHVLMIAAGAVRTHESRMAEAGHAVTHLGAHHMLSAGAFESGLRQMGTLGDGRVLRDLDIHLSLEIVLTQGVLRYSIEAEEFNFECLGDRRSGSLRANFSSLVNDLTARFPEAVVNRGAHYLRENPSELFVYPTRNAFIEEIVWILWRIRAAQDASSPR